MSTHCIIALCSIIMTLQLSYCKYQATVAEAVIPQSVVVGTSGGEIERCLFDDVNQCKKLHSLKTPILSLATAGEFIYAGLGTGLHRCHLHKGEKCSTFHKCDSTVNALTIFGKYVFVGTDEGIIYRCGLRKSDTCSIFYEAVSGIHSLTAFTDLLYVGSEKTLLSCPLDESDMCTELINMKSTINTLNYDSEFIYAGLGDGAVVRCALNSDQCTTLHTAHSAINTLDVFDSYLQAALSSGQILRYHLGKNESLTFNKSDGLVLSMSSIYALGELYHHYAGESINCTWQFWNCPPFVNYYDVESRYSLQLHVEDGLIYNSEGELFDTSHADYGHTGRKAIFVMDPVGRIYASNRHPVMLLHHSSLLAGNPVAASGELSIIQGQLKEASSCSGHYRQSIKMTKQIKDSLRRQGYKKKFKFLDCELEKLMIDLYYNKLDLYYDTKYGKNYVRPIQEWEEEGFLLY